MNRDELRKLAEEIIESRWPGESLAKAYLEADDERERYREHFESIRDRNRDALDMLDKACAERDSLKAALEKRTAERDELREVAENAHRHLDMWKCDGDEDEIRFADSELATALSKFRREP